MTFTEVILTILRVSEEENSTIAYSGAACNMSSTCYGGVYQGEYTPTEVQYSTVQYSTGESTRGSTPLQRYSTVQY